MGNRKEVADKNFYSKSYKNLNDPKQRTQRQIIVFKGKVFTY